VISRAALLIALSFVALPASAQLDKILGGLGKSATSGNAANSDSKIASGLKEALTIGTTNAVKLTGTTDGYFKNELIKIVLPPKLRTAEKGLRLVGAGPQLDEFVLGMNRAAEKAAPEATKYFKEAILNMTFSDAKGILSGGDTAATDFFKSKTSAQLTTAFRPHVEAAMGQLQITKQFDGIMTSLKKVPFMKAESFDINDYVVQQAINGLFIMVGQEEKKIRKDPAAQVTSLLKDVFGRK
jgi:hypothetical protein